MQVSKEDVEAIFGQDTEYIGPSDSWSSVEEYLDNGAKKIVTGRVLVTHGHQGDIFNMPFTPGPECPQELAEKVVCMPNVSIVLRIKGTLPVGYFISRLVAASKNPNKTSPKVLRLALNAVVPNEAFLGIVSTMGQCPNSQELFKKDPYSGF